MTRRRGLVCGATGFIGRNIVEALSRRGDMEVHAVRFTRPAWAAPGVTWHQADLRQAAEVNRLLGTALDGSEVRRLLEPIGFAVEPAVEAPSDDAPAADAAQEPEAPDAETPPA